MRAITKHSEHSPEPMRSGDDIHLGDVMGELDRFFRAVRRQIRIVILAAVVAFAIGAAWIVYIQPLYTANTLLLIDNRRIRAVEDAYDRTPQTADTASSIVDSQVEVFRSEKIALAVIKKLNLFEKIGPVPPRQGLFLKLRNALLGEGSAAATARTPEESMDAYAHRVAEVLSFGFDVHRVGRTMILQISYTSPDPVQAARMANAYADAYLADQLDAKYEATKRASEWLESRMTELKEKALQSDLAIQKFKEDNHLISSSGKLVNEQQLSEVNSQLVSARSDLSRAEARYHRLSTIISNHQTEALVSEAISNTAIEALRAKYLDASKRAHEISIKYGSDHLLAQNLRAEMGEYERLMFEELGRLAESYRSEVDIDKSREQSLSASVTKLVSENASDNKTLVQLHELEREGAAYRTLHENYLQKYQESLQQQSFPIIDARVITSASIPSVPSFPHKAVTLMLFLFAGGALGCLIGIYREFRERGFRGEAQITDSLRLECLGILPLIKPKAASTGRDVFLRRGKSKTVAAAESQIISSNVILGDTRRWIKPVDGIMTYATENPGTNFSETLLATKLAADLSLSDEPSKIIGVVSALPNEGKTMVSKNLASLLASLGSSTILIDADLRGPQLTKRVAPEATQGIVEAVINKTSIEDLLWWEQTTNLGILPGVVRGRIHHSAEVLGSHGMHTLLRQAQDRFEYVVLDLPPLGPVVDVRAITSRVHAFVLVVEWRQTPRNFIRTILDQDEALKRKCLGVVLNKVNTGEITLHETQSSKFYYQDKYSKYYYSGKQSDA